MSDSAFKAVRQAIAQKFAIITTAHGYHTDPAIVQAIRDPKKIGSFPEIGIHFGSLKLEAKNSTATLFDGFIDVYVAGYVKANTSTDADNSALQTALDDIQHDLLRVISSFYMTEIEAASGFRWNVSRGTKEIQFTPFVNLGDEENIGVVHTEFRIQIRNLDTSLDD